jgi:protein SCO1
MKMPPAQSSGRSRLLPRALVLMIAAALGINLALAHEAAAPRAKLDFVPPAPGSYRLQRIMTAPDGVVLDVNGERKTLANYTADRVTLLCFIYTTCNDPKGCPIAYEVLARLKKEILAKPALKDKVRFVSLSFDPLRDTFEVMKHYGGSHVKNDRGLAWYFLTTPSPKDLLPLLDGFGQDVRYGVDKDTGKARRQLSHVLKVFLIDKTRQVREIYTTSFLLPQVVLNDIETLLLEEPKVDWPSLRIR